MTLQEVRERANKIATDMAALMAKAKGESRELSSDEEGQFDTMHGDREKLLKQEERLLVLDRIENGGNRRTDPSNPEELRKRAGAEPVKITEEQRADAIQAWMLGGSDRRTAAHVEAAKRLGISLDQKSITLRLPQVPMPALRGDRRDAWEKRYLGVDVISPDNGGHFLVPDELMRELEVARLAFGGMLQTSTVIRTNTGAELPFPTMNDTANEGVLIGESIQETNNLEPTLSQLTLHAFTYSSKKVPMSVEFIQDNAVGAVARIGSILGERLARIQNRHATVGTGSTQPNGIVVASASSSVTTASASVVTYDNLVDLEHSVDPSYRTGARFMFNDTTLKVLKKIKVPQFSGDTAGYPLWKPGMVTGDPDTINGYPYTINQHMASGSGAKSILFGLLSKYQLREVRDVQIVRLDELYAEYRQVVFLAWMRFDGDLLDAGTNPVKYLTQGA
jgi:HK97 family phage major capsid protein